MKPPSNYSSNSSNAVSNVYETMSNANNPAVICRIINLGPLKTFRYMKLNSGKETKEDTALDY